MGFSQVSRYVAGRLDCFALGLPIAGDFATIPKAMDVVRRDVPICHLTDRVGEIHQRFQEAGWQVCIVVNEANIVLARLRREAWNADPATPVEQVMENGPSTFRPDVILGPVVRRMHEKKVGSVIITNSDGVLIGILYRKDAKEKSNQNQPVHERA